MKRILLFFFVLTGALARAQDHVRIRLYKEMSQLQLQGKALRMHSEKRIPISYQAEQKFSLQRENGIWYIEKSGVKTQSQDPYILVSGQELMEGSHRLPDKLAFVPSKKENTFDIIAFEKMDLYLAGVISQEMPLTWSLESLKAQSVVARSYVLHKMQFTRKKLYDVESTVLDQVYKSIHNAQMSLSQKAVQAVAATQNMVLRDSKNRILKTFYHADCGGGTSTAQNVFQETTESQSVKDKSCPLNPRAQWQYELKTSELSRLLQHDSKTLSRLKVGRDAQGRIVEMEFFLQDPQGAQHKVLLLGESFRRLVGYSLIRSLNFEYKISQDKISFVGKGFGHGVGLCQWGTESLAQSGQTYQKILKHYFPNAKIETLNPSWL